MIAHGARRPAVTTITSAVLIFAVTAFWLFAGILLLVETGTAARGAFIVGTCAAAIVVGIGILLRKVWARWTGVGMFIAFGLATLAVAVGTAGGGLASSLPLIIADLLAVVLLLVPATTRDFRSAPPPPPTSSPPA